MNRAGDFERQHQTGSVCGKVLGYFYSLPCRFAHRGVEACVFQTCTRITRTRLEERPRVRGAVHALPETPSPIVAPFLAW